MKKINPFVKIPILVIHSFSAGKKTKEVKEKKFRAWKIIVLALILIMVLGGCDGVVTIDNIVSTEEVTAKKKVGKKIPDEIIKIGAPLSITGKLASFGEDIKNGIALAVDEVNQQEKIRIEIIYEDTQSEAVQSVNAVKKLIEIDGVNIILGPVRSSNILAVAPLTEAKKIIMITSIGSSIEITNAGDYVFRNRATAKLSEEKMAEFLANKGVNKVAVFAAQSSNSLTYKKIFIEKFKKLGKEIVFSTNYNENILDFKTDITKAKSKGAEAFYLAATGGGDGGILTKQLKELGVNSIIAGVATFESEEFLTGAGEAAEGVFITSPAFNIENPDIQNYRNKYKKLHNKESSAYAANAYDAVKIIANAIEGCGGDKDTDCIRDYLYSVKDYPGIGGNTTFDENGDVIKPVMIKIVKDGEFAPYEEN